jgi:hypothetical protein
VNSKVRQQVTIGIVATVWLVLALLAGGTLSPTPLKLYSIAGAVVTVVWLIYDRYLWRWTPVRRLTGTPLLAGTWRGSLASSHAAAAGSLAPPISVVLRVSQTASDLTLTLFTEESISTSTQSQLTRLGDGRWSINWLYVNSPRPGVQHRSQRHTGAAEMTISGHAGETLSGTYFTERLTRGELSFGEWSRDKFGDAQSALSSGAFGPARPFG